MNTTLQLNPRDQTIRTQITLTKQLKKIIESEIKPKNQSLSEYLRQAAILKLYLDRQEKVNLQQLADETVGSLNLDNYPEWKTTQKTTQWQKHQRQQWQK